MKQQVIKLSIGFGASLLLTLVAFWLVIQHVQDSAALPADVLVPRIIGLAVIQLIVQLYFFLHLGNESKPRWNFIVFLFMILVLVIVVLGSIWIMDNLNYNMMPHEMTEYMKEHPGSF